MKALRIILIVLIVLVGGYAIWMATIDPEYHVKRTAIIEAEPEQVYATVSDFKTWKDWSKWHKMDPDMEVTYGDKSAGEGATYTWEGEKAGAGTQTITAAVPNESLETHIAFEGMGESDGYWKFEPVDEGTQVTWGFTGEMPFFYRVFSLGMDESVGGDFEEGLANLKEKVESMPVSEKTVSNPINIEMVELKALPYYGIRHEMAIDEMSHEDYASSYEELGSYLGKDASTPLMPPIAIYYKWDEENNQVVFEPAMVVESNKPGTDQIHKAMTHGGMALKAVHKGGWDTGDIHMALGNEMQTKGYLWPEDAGAWEVYVAGPANEPDTAKWVTEVYYPIKTVDGEPLMKSDKKAS